MRLKQKWHSKIFARPSKNLRRLEDADSAITANCDDSGSSNNSVMDKTDIQHYTQTPSIMEPLPPTKEPAAVTKSRIFPSPASRDESSASAAVIEESFECVYREEDTETKVEIDSRDDCPSLLIPAVLTGDSADNDAGNTSTQFHDFCTCSSTTRNQLPHLHPSKWPQAPLLLRPQPNGGTRILGIRKESKRDQFLWRPGQVEPWWEVLHKECGQTTAHNSNIEETSNTQQYCEYCVVLPINNGCEEQGESLVVDFESPLFQGTLLFRLKDTNGTTKNLYQKTTSTTKGYFDGKVIRYQAVLRGRFKTSLPFSELITGTRLDRPCGKLPPKWVMWTALKVMHFFAPQVQTELEKTDKPIVLSPLGSAPRTIVIEDDDGMADDNNPESCLLSKEYAEPTDAAGSILNMRNPVVDSLERARARRKLMDQWAMAKNAAPKTQTDKIYTFEFLQHLFDYHNFTIELGNSFHVSVKDMLNGQPLQIMAEHHREGQEYTLNNKLWSFQIWNECLWDDAMEHIQHQ